MNVAQMQHTVIADDAGAVRPILEIVQEQLAEYEVCWKVASATASRSTGSGSSPSAARWTSPGAPRRAPARAQPRRR